jgi:hypothetical protein
MGRGGLSKTKGAKSKGQRENQNIQPERKVGKRTK